MVENLMNRVMKGLIGSVMNGRTNGLTGWVENVTNGQTKSKKGDKYHPSSFLRYD